MVAAISNLKSTSAARSELLSRYTVMVADRDFAARRRCTSALEGAGFGLILAAGDLETAGNYFREHACDLLIIDPNVGTDFAAAFDFIRTVRAGSQDTMVSVFTGTPSLGLCYRAARVGVSDFFIKGPHLAIAAEAARLLDKQHAGRKTELGLATGLFSSVGVTRGEMAILEEFSRGYPKQQDIARRLDKDDVYIRKVFSRVYKKMETYLPINNQAQLSHLMTVCSLFE